MVIVTHFEGYTRFETYPRPDLNSSGQTFIISKSSRTLNWITDTDEKSMRADFLNKIDPFNGRSAERPDANAAWSASDL